MCEVRIFKKKDRYVVSDGTIFVPCGSYSITTIKTIDCEGARVTYEVAMYSDDDHMNYRGTAYTDVEPKVE